MPLAHGIVNTEQLRVAEPPPGFSGHLNFSVDGSSGNSRESGVALGTRLQWHEDNVTDFLVLSYDYGESFGIRNSNHVFAHARHIEFWNDHWAWEAFIQSEQDEFTRLEYRHLAGGGVRRLMSRTPDKTMYVGLGGFYSRERIDERLGIDEELVDKLWRVNSYLVMNYQFNESVLAGVTLYYQPALRDAGDFRLLLESALSFNISERFDFVVKLNVTHDSRPPATVKDTDIDYVTGVEIRFRP